MNIENLKISRATKIEILKRLSLEENKLFNKIDPEEFFDEVLNLRELPSQDARYKDAYGDFRQHYINNNDWELEYILLDRFNFLDSDILFFKLLNLIISPKINSSEDDIQFFYFLLNSYLEKEKLTFKLDGYDENDLPIYQIDELTYVDKLSDIPNNKINFNLNVTEGQDLEYFYLIKTIWDDYSERNEFKLFYINNDIKKEIGKLKIISLNGGSTTELIKENFTNLSDEYCSLGESIEYYKNLKEFFPKKYRNILKGLRDAAFFTSIQELFENSKSFKNSLIRYDAQEQVLRQAKYIIYNYDLKNLYSFEYKFNPPFNTDIESIKFDFDENKIIGNRIYVIIGKNGVGKTQLVSKLPNDISNKKDDFFSPKSPLFSKIIAVSYSVFDKFNIPEQSSNFNYIYCGLRDKDINGEYQLDKNQLLNRFYESVKKIIYSNRDFLWLNILKHFIGSDEIELWVSNSELNRQKFLKSFEKFSSGQSIFVFIFTEILANIRYDSLIIFDEPETHLHPNAISQLINCIHFLTKKFKSFCIIATHSPIIVQGVLSKNVYVLNKEDENLTISHPNIETFGENLTTITDDIFGNRDVEPHFLNDVKKLIESGKNFNEIINLLKTENIPLSLNLTILIKSLLVSEGLNDD